MSGFVWLLSLCAAAGVVYLALSIRARHRLERNPPPKSPEELAAEQALKTDKLAQAELAAGNLEAARKLFVEARRPGKAAQVAVREGRFDLAGELFEKDGRVDKALVAYRKAGLLDRVALIEQRMAEQKASVVPAAKVSEAPAARKVSERAPKSVEPPEPALALPQLGDVLGEPPPEPDDDGPARDSDAWLLEDGLLDLPGAPPSARPQPVPAPNQSAASRVALGVIALIKPRRMPRAVIEEAPQAPRASRDDR